jgi:hypothetical protein
VDAGADEILLPGDLQAPVSRSGGHDHRVRGELLPSRQRRHQVFAVVLDSGDRHRRQQFHSIAAGLAMNRPASSAPKIPSENPG